MVIKEVLNWIELHQHIAHRKSTYRVFLTRLNQEIISKNSDAALQYPHQKKAMSKELDALEKK